MFQPKLQASKEHLKNVGEAASARQKQTKKAEFIEINEHFEFVFNAAMATQVIFQRFLRFVPINYLEIQLSNEITPQPLKEIPRKRGSTIRSKLNKFV